MYLVIIGSGIGLSPVRRQAIAWTNVAYCQSDPWEQVSVKLEFEFYPFHTEYAFDNVVYLGLGLYVLRQPLMIELHISYAAEHWILKPMFYCSTVVSRQETDTDRCKDAFPLMDCLYCYCACIMIYVSPLVHLRSINYYYYYYLHLNMITFGPLHWPNVITFTFVTSINLCRTLFLVTNMALIEVHRHFLRRQRWFRRRIDFLDREAHSDGFAVENSSNVFFFQDESSMR